MSGCSVQVDERVSMTKQKNDSGTIKGICMKFKPGQCIVVKN
jgi:hypothetical protein